jgi:hypothetical protein
MLLHRIEEAAQFIKPYVASYLTVPDHDLVGGTTFPLLENAFADETDPMIIRCIEGLKATHMFEIYGDLLAQFHQQYPGLPLDHPVFVVPGALRGGVVLGGLLVPEFEAQRSFRTEVLYDTVGKGLAGIMPISDIEHLSFGQRMYDEHASLETQLSRQFGGQAQQIAREMLNPLIGEFVGNNIPRIGEMLERFRGYRRNFLR